jgi:formylglycine-generating enzyme required for sulfatase activity
MKIMRCPHCGQEHSNQSTVCPVTGNPIVAFECPNCGQVVMAGTQFCPYCNFDMAATTARRPERWLLLLLAGAGLVLAILAVAFFIVIGRPNGQSTSTLPAASLSSPGQPSQAPGSQPPVVNLTFTPTTFVPSIQSSPSPLSSTPPPCTTIGQTWVRPADRSSLVCVPGGSFEIGLKTCDFNGCQNEVKGGTVTLEAFWIDRTEVTNAMFGLFVNQTGFVTGAERAGASEVYGITTPVPGADWLHPQGPASSISGLDSYPVVQMSYFAAAAYCAWAGGSLPTEAQWEKAARGGDGRLFPWGDQMPNETLLNAADSNLPVPWAQKDQNDGYRYTAPVGSFLAGESPYGAEDMAGNAWEWTRSLYKDYPYNPSDGRETQTAPAAGDKVVLRGGGWYSDYGSVRSTLRYGAIPDLSNDATGFRCVYP